MADRQVNSTELAALNKWLGTYQEFLGRHPFSELVPHIHAVVADGVIEEDERSDLLWLCERFSGASGFYDDVTAGIQQLHGFLGGIIADGRVNKKELEELSAWVDDHAHLRCCWPYDELESVIAHVLKDGKIDDQEHEALLQFFGEFTIGPDRKAVGALDRESTVSGVCAFGPEIEFSDRFFCFTGASKRTTRNGLATVVRQLGGDYHPNLRNDTHFLIVGADGNPCWAYSCYGRKVEDAVHRRRKGQRLLIVHELDFWDAVRIAAARLQHSLDVRCLWINLYAHLTAATAAPAHTLRPEVDQVPLRRASATMNPARRTWAGSATRRGDLRTSAAIFRPRHQHGKMPP